MMAGAAALIAAKPALAEGRMFVPAEEDPHEATFMQWPNSRSVYADRSFLRTTQRAIADLATISEVMTCAEALEAL